MTQIPMPRLSDKWMVKDRHVSLEVREHKQVVWNSSKLRPPPTCTCATRPGMSMLSKAMAEFGWKCGKATRPWKPRTPTQFQRKRGDGSPRRAGILRPAVAKGQAWIPGVIQDATNAAEAATMREEVKFHAHSIDLARGSRSDRLDQSLSGRICSITSSNPTTTFPGRSRKRSIIPTA